MPEHWMTVHEVKETSALKCVFSKVNSYSNFGFLGPLTESELY